MKGEKIIYEYSLLRYVADVEREEFVNVGLLMMSKRWRWMKCAINIDEDKLNAVFKRCNIGRLRHQISLFQRCDVPASGLSVEERYRWMAAVKSAVIQTSPSHPGILLVQDELNSELAKKELETKFEELFRRLVL